MSNKLNINLIITGSFDAPAEQTASLLTHLKGLGADVGVSTPDAPTPASEAPAAPAPAVEPQYLTLGSNDVIRSGDEWILKSQYRTKKLSRQWRMVDKSVGDRVSAHAKSDFRRKIG